MKEVFLERVTLNNYRNFSDKFIQFKPGINIIIGENGTGKTNILESISFLSPGKGLKSASFNEIKKIGSEKWTTNFKLKSILGSAEIHSTFQEGSLSRKIFYNGSKISGSDLTKLLSVIWLTPQMESLFLDSSSSRRKFFDRIVFSFYPDHAKNIAKYDHYMRQRNKSLACGNLKEQDSLLSILENQMAKEAVKIATSRENSVGFLQETINSLKTDFPKAQIYISPIFESEEQWDSFELNYSQILSNNRQKDFYSGRTNFGVHKMDMNVYHQEKQQQARQCSTGEQKALLISIVLASIESIKQSTGVAPILLLDELFVHLDGFRKNCLSSYIKNSNLQTFITTTDIIGFEDLVSNAHIIEL